MAARYEEVGYECLPDLIDLEACERLSNCIDALDLCGPGSRNVLDHEWCRVTARELRAHPMVASMLPVSAVCAQCTHFVKDAHRNWGVSYHQDLSIPVGTRVDDPECAGWSEKEGIRYVQQPTNLLADLVAVRVQLDDATSQSGPLRVIPRTHRLGQISDEQISALRANQGEVERAAASQTIVRARSVPPPPRHQR